MGLVGPGATPQITTDVKPTLDGASEYEFITLLNPLTDDFAIQVAQDVPVNMPFEIRKDGATSTITNTEADARQVYGLSLKNPDFQSRKHISNVTVIKAGQTVNLKGDAAQVAVRQLVNEIGQREGKTRLLADPTVRKEIEDRIIITRGSIQDLMDGNIRSVREQATEAINRSNEVTNEQEFPELNRTADSTPERGDNLGADSTAPEKRSVGRPKKAENHTS